jgi:hypothetical protein
MAFLRRKRVNGYGYFQVVRNYRDANGKHRQEMLCYLGPHDSLETAIAAEQKKIKIHRERAFLQRKRAAALRNKILDLHGWELDGEIPDIDEASREWDACWERWDNYDNYGGIDIEELRIELDMYSSCLDYYEAIFLAGEADYQGDEYEAKLDKYLRVQREYF